MANRKNVGSLTLDYISINPEDIDGKRFNVSKNLEEAKKSLESYIDYRVEKVRVDFDDNEWIFRELFSRSRVMFNYAEIFNLIKFSKIKDEEILFIAIKCWIIKELNENSITIAQNKLLNIHSALLSTNILSDTRELVEMIQSSTLIRKENDKFTKRRVSGNVLQQFITDLADFLRFYDQDRFTGFLNELSELKSKLKLEKTYRKLPSFKDVLTIKSVLDSWFEEAKKNDSKELLKYYPLVLWWNLTSIIPMRIVEFLYIKRNCFSFEDGNCFITFPRMKYGRIGEHRTEIKYDKLPIPIELYNLIKNYVKLSEKYGESEYLISYKVYRHYIKHHNSTINDNILFNHSDLHYTLASFFKNILHERYKININYVNKSYRATYNLKAEGEVKLISSSPIGSIDRMINPGDLRHIAIINMMMQGYDKVEIQRLAGHITEDTQYSYFNHMENWMDIEIQKMEKEFSHYRPINSSKNEIEITTLHPNVHNFFENQSKKDYIYKNLHEEVEEDYLKLDLGSCMDITMPCPSFNWKHRGCYFCEHWFISNKELEEKKSQIASDLNLMYDETKAKIKFLQSIFRHQQVNSENTNNNIKQNLSSTSKEIQLDIKRIAKLKSMLGVLDDE